MQSDTYCTIEKAIKFIEDNFERQPSLEEIASSVNLSVFHFERLFKRWAGVTPKQFLQFLTLEYAKILLKKSRTVMETAYLSGLSSQGRLYDHFVSIDAITPGEYKTLGQGLRIQYGIHETLFGRSFIGLTERGICSFRFADDKNTILRQLKKEWLNAEIIENQAATGKVVKQIFQSLDKKDKKPIHLFLKGTNFQVKVWQALLTIPLGQVLSNEDIAKLIGDPSNVESVSNATSQNPIGYLIPCHRVIWNTGVLGNYLWGSTRKKAILGWEFSKKDGTENDTKLY